MADTLRILLIADDPEMIRRVGQGLHQGAASEVVVEGADNLATASRRLRAAPYDLALADLSLGRGDGLRMLSEFIGTEPGLPVVALANGAKVADAAACLSVGAQDRIAVDALDGAGLLDRLQAVLVRARTSHDARQRSHRIAASLAAGGELAWHFRAGEKDVWLASPDPAAWQLPGPECRESLEALRSWLHPDDRELALRRLEEMAHGAEPWELEARIKVGSGGYRWCALRGRSQLDKRGRLAHAAGVVTDAQRQHKRLLSLQDEHRFMRAVFDSNRLPQAVLDGAGMITQCNAAWAALEEPGCHAGAAFAPGRSFFEPGDDASYGDLDPAALARGVKQVLGGVVEHHQCEYGDEARRWRISVSPLLNPGIAGALVAHEEVTATRKVEKDTRARLTTLARDFQAVSGPVFRLGPDLEVRGANEAAMKIGRAPVVGRDIFKVLPRAHSDAVGDGIAALAAGSEVAVRDVRGDADQMLRWLVSARRDTDGEQRGFLLQAIDVSDLAPPLQADEEQKAQAHARELAQLRTALERVEGERARLGELLATAESGVQDARAELERMRSAADDAAHANEKLQLEIDQARLDAREARLEAEDAARREARVKQAGEDLEKALATERARREEEAQAARRAQEEAVATHQRESARLKDAVEVAQAEAQRLRQAMEEVRGRMQADFNAVMDRTLSMLASDPDPDPDAGTNMDVGDTVESRRA
jgi:CheY-like chemotaxis protein